MFKFIIKILLILILSFVFLFILYLFQYHFKIFLKSRKMIKRHHSKKRRKLHLIYTYLYTPHKFKSLEFCKWCIVDFFRGKDKLRLWGIWAFTGYYGTGKTMGAINYALYLQKKYPKRNILIFSNIWFRGCCRVVRDYKEILDLPENSIFVYDESQNDFNSNDRNFPIDLLRRITQCRKRQLAMFMTSPVYTRMNINIRESVNFIIECNNYYDADRWFKYTFYRREVYEQYYENREKLNKNVLFHDDFIATDKVYRRYDTKHEVDTIKVDDVAVKSKKDVLYLKDYLDTFEYDFKNTLYKEIDLKFKELKKC